jgi:hypothetical protein
VGNGIETWLTPHLHSSHSFVGVDWTSCPLLILICGRLSVESIGRSRRRRGRPHDAGAGTVGEMSSRVQTRRRRWVLALVLVAVAVGLVVVEPFHKGRVLLSLTSTHGIDAGDLPALALLLVAAGLVI